MDTKIYYYLDQVEKLRKGEWVPPVTCEIDPSNYCMLSCDFCMYQKYLEGDRRHLSYDVYGSLLYELDEIGTKSITFTGGGEPLMNPKINRMIEDAVKMEFEIGLVTNGVLLNNIDNLDKFKFIRVSLDASNPKMYNEVKGTDHFDRVIDNIKMTLEKNKTVGLSYVVNDRNNFDLDKAQKLADELGVAYLQFKPAWMNGKIFDDYEIPGGEKVIKTNRYVANDDLPCLIASLIGVVGADGEVYFCCQHRGESKFSLGSLYIDKFETIWKRRFDLHPNISKCPMCRYMNYAEEYRKILEKGTLFFEHRNFL